MKLKITVHGIAYEVDVEVLDAGEGFPGAVSLPRTKVKEPRDSGAGSISAHPASGTSGGPAPSSVNTDGGQVASPIAGTIVEIKCKVGDTVNQGQVLLVIEAMKMKTSIAAPTSGKVKSIPIAVGDSVRESQTLVEFE
jgi:biotin carboxyl carrier protein